VRHTPIRIPRARTTSDATSAGAVPRGTRVRHERLPSKEYGEAFLVYCCADCGSTGDLEAFPARCLDCGAPRESLYYYVED
jgi:hypothetical protein